MSGAELFASAGQLLGLGSWGLVVFLLLLLLKERSNRQPLEMAWDKQQADLGIAMLKTAREEIGRLNGELSDARVWADVHAHLIEAEGHIAALIEAEPAELAMAKRRARAFLNRMARLREARGTARNELQIRDSKERREGKEE